MISAAARRIDMAMRCRSRFILGAALLAVLLPVRVWGRSPSPLDVVRRFCQADGIGHRLHPARWEAIAPWVSWAFEPAWDRVLIISGYQIHAPRYLDDHVEITVDYTVIQEVAAGQTDETAQTPQIEQLVLRVVNDGSGGWRIAGPPPPPHVFANQVEVAAMQASLQPTAPDYLSDSAFVWRMLNDAGWAIPYWPVSQLHEPGVFAPVDEPKPGDVALFLAGDVPYHVGLVIADGLVASATINAGLVQTAPEAFPGAVRYLRIVQPKSAVATPAVASDASRGEVVPARTPTPHAARARQAAQPPQVRPAKKTTKNAAKNARKKKPHPRPTATPRRRPVARATPTHSAR